MKKEHNLETNKYKLKMVLFKYFRCNRLFKDVDDLIDNIIRLYNVELRKLDTKQKPKNMKSVELYIDWFIREFCSKAVINEQEIKGRSREELIVIPRNVLIYAILERWTVPCRVVGEHFGNRNHSTVRNSKFNAVEMLETKHKEAIRYFTVCQKVLQNVPDLEEIKKVMNNE